MYDIINIIIISTVGLGVLYHEYIRDAVGLTMGEYYVPTLPNVGTQIDAYVQSKASAALFEKNKI